MRLMEGLKQTVIIKPAMDGPAYQANDRLYRFDGARGGTAVIGAKRHQRPRGNARGKA